MNNYKIFLNSVRPIEIKFDGNDIELVNNNPVIGTSKSFNNLQEVVTILKKLITKYPELDLTILEV